MNAENVHVDGFCSLLMVCTVAEEQDREDKGQVFKLISRELRCGT